MRGKHGASAAARHAIEDRDAEIGTYQARVAKLTAENKRLRERIDSQQRDNAREIKRLKAERNEGVSPMLRALEGENKRLREAADHAEREVKEIRIKWGRATERMHAHFANEHGETNAEAWTTLMGLISDDGRRHLYVGEIHGDLNKDPEKTMRIARARGLIS